MSAGAASEHQRFADDVAVYALGALGAEHAGAFEAHLSECSLCRDELAAVQPAVDALAVGVPPMATPPALKGRLMAVVEREAQLLQAAGPDADRTIQAPGRRRRWRGRGVALAAGAGLAAAGLAAGALLFAGDTGPQLRPASVAQSLGPGTHASVRIGRGRAQLQVADLPDPPSGRVWQVWIKRAGRAPQPGPVFELRTGAVPLPAGGPRGTQVMVTNEPRGGSPAPSTPPVIVSQL